MRRVLASLVVVALAGVSEAAPRQWQSGIWGELTPERDRNPSSRAGRPTFTIETENVRLEVQDLTRAGGNSSEFRAGTPVTFALDNDKNKNVVYVRESGNTERRYRLVRKIEKKIEKTASPASRVPTYSALGSGHLLRSVSSDGRYVTLEDGSVWEIDPRDQFQTVQWEPMATMAVQTVAGRPEFPYVVVNTTEDEGAGARYIPNR